MRYSTWLRKTGLPFLLILFLSPFLSDRLEAGTNHWTTYGPGGGDAKALAIDPATPSTLYAGTDGGGVFDLTYVDVTGDFSFRKMISIENTKVSGATDFSNFPVLVSLTGNWLKSTAVDPINGRIESDNGYDIVFHDETESTQLDHEIEKYDGANGVLVAWVRLPILSYNTDTVFYMEYGNSSISSSQEDAVGVWGVNYAGGWHLNESVTDEAGVPGVHADSTFNANHGDQDGNADITGKIENGQDFDGIDDLIEILDAPVLNPPNDMTLSAWFKINQLPSVVGDIFRIVCKRDTQWSYSLYIEINDLLTFSWRGVSSGTNYAEYNIGVSVDTWYHVVDVKDSFSDDLLIFINVTIRQQPPIPHRVHWYMPMVPLVLELGNLRGTIWMGP